ncbi:MAG TPA: serine--tRNA ligase, partial [Candidatus Aciduliprofundum boonei]|nr:serine--tRNA ligase [Candidatus Aciduliprofundum boonei]
MLDIKLIREEPELVKEMLKKRFEDPSIVDEILDYDRKWRNGLREIERLRHLRNEKSAEIGKLVKMGRDISSLKEKMKELNLKIKEMEIMVKEYKTKRDYLLMSLPNLLDETTPVCEG